MSGTRKQHQKSDAHEGTADASEGTDRPHGPPVANCPPTATQARHRHIHAGRFHTDADRTRSHAAATFSASIGVRKNAPNPRNRRQGIGVKESASKTYTHDLGIGVKDVHTRFRQNAPRAH